MIKKSKADIKSPKYIGTGSYTFQKKLPEKDNYMIYDPLPGDSYNDKPISMGEAIEWGREVRVPSLKRKAAWKRFYKLFPHLKGKKIIHGSSQPMHAYGVNASTIKLKKVKK